MNEDTQMNREPGNGAASRSIELQEPFVATIAELRLIETEIVSLTADGLAHWLSEAGKVASGAVRVSAAVTSEIIQATDSVATRGIASAEAVSKRLTGAAREVSRDWASLSGEWLRLAAAQSSELASEIVQQGEKVVVRLLASAVATSRGALELGRAIVTGSIGLAGEAGESLLGAAQGLVVRAVDGAGEIAGATLLEPRLGLASVLAHAREVSSASRELAS